MCQPVPVSKKSEFTWDSVQKETLDKGVEVIEDSIDEYLPKVTAIGASLIKTGAAYCSGKLLADAISPSVDECAESTAEASKKVLKKCVNSTAEVALKAYETCVDSTQSGCKHVFSWL